MMKRFIYAVLTALMILSGCNKYHPYYDGQEFCILDSYSGTLIKEDGGYVSVTLQREYEDMFVVEFYGGKGKNHTVTVADPEFLDYRYEKGDVKTPPFDYEINPAKIILLPKKLGDTSISVTDEDTGESIRFHVHIGNAYRALSVNYGQPVFNSQTLLAFKCDGNDDVLEICERNGRYIVHVVSGKYSFVDIGGFLYFEMTYPADEEGRPVSGGVDTFRRYQVQFAEGGATDPVDMMWYLNLSELHVQTKETVPDMYMTYFRFVDVTSVDESELTTLFDPYYYPEDPNESPQRLFNYFNTSSATYVNLDLE